MSINRKPMIGQQSLLSPKSTSTRCLTIIICLLCYFILPLTSTTQLYMSHLSRHGARYSVYDYYDYNQTRQFSGLLTSVGLREHYLLGSYLSSEYVMNEKTFLNRTLKTRETQFFTLFTQGGRCEESAYAQALGLFGFEEGERIPDDFNKKLLQPPFETIFPFRLTVEQAPDNFALEKGFQPVPMRFGQKFFPECPNFNVILNRRAQELSKILAQFQSEQLAFTQKMCEMFNLPIPHSNISNLQQLADTIISDRFLNRDLPSAFSQSDYHQLYYIRSYMLASLYSGEVAQILNAPYILSILHNMEMKIANKLSQKKYTSISVHDLNIIPLLTYYNLTSPECLKNKFNQQIAQENCVNPIPFAMNLIFQLHQDKSSQPIRYFVKTRYNGLYVKLFDRNTLQVQWAEFATKSKAGLKDFNTECKISSQKQNNQNESQRLKFIVQ